MNYEGFIASVQETAHIPGEEAERVACATLQTLSERITSGESEDLAARLPRELRACVDTDHRPDTFHLDEFLRRVAERARIDPPNVAHETRAVLTALRRAVGPEEFDDVRAQLPSDFDPLLDDAVRDAPSEAFDAPVAADAMPYDGFVARVAERAGVDPEHARRAADAVLEELAVRISGGQVEDLERRLAPELRAPLERGRARSGGPAKPYSLDTFLAEIARKDGVDRGRATEHARAVLETLREAVGEKEWRDTTEQLPDDYRALWKQG